MLVAVGLGHVALLVSLAEARASRAGLAQVTARVAAEAAVNAVLRVEAGASTDSIPVGAGRRVVSLALGPVLAQGTARRLGAESWLIEGEGAAPGRPAERSARLAWAFDPLTRVLALEGALSVPPGGLVAVEGTVDVDAPAAAVAPMHASTCAPFADSLNAEYARSPLSVVASPPLGTPGGNPFGPPPLALDGADTITWGLAPPRVLTSPAGTPAPVESAGRCDEGAAWNWGDPDHPWRPCGSYLPVRASDGDVLVSGGVGQAVLLARGDVRLSAGARLYGLVVAGGTFGIADGSSFEGLAIAHAGVEVSAGSRVRASGCWAARALSETRGELRRWIVIRGVGAVGPW